MATAAEYVLSAYSFIKTSSRDELLNVGYQSNEGNPIPSFDENVLLELCSEAKLIFEKENTILELEGDFIIVGDIHGSFHDLLRILNYHQKVNLRVLFLGDYVDRGEFSLECITLLFALKIIQPTTFYLLRGNHEFDSVCSQYGFKNEIIDYHNPKKIKLSSTQLEDIQLKSSILDFKFDEAQEPEKNSNNHTFDDKCDMYYADHNDMNCYKYSEKLYEAFIQAFSYLPISATINNTTFCIHGGLSPKLEVLDHLRKGIIRPIDSFEDNKLLSDVVWSDPSNGFASIFDNNPRGRGCLYNSVAVTNFLNVNSLNRIIRAHQCVKHGSLSQFNDKCITVFSASSYSPEMANNSGILKLFQKEDKIRYVTLSPLPRLKKSDANYYKVQAFSETERNRSFFSIRHPKLSVMQSLSPFCTKRLKMIKMQQSQRILTQQRFSKPSFVTTSRKTNPSIKKPLAHSISIDDFIDESKTIHVQRSLPNIDDNKAETHKMFNQTRSLLNIDDFESF